MTFAPGQFLTAQRLNRLQSTTYWVAASSGLGASASTVDVPGATMSITTQTNGATAAMFWSCDFRTTAVTTVASCRPLWDVNGSPVFAVFKSGSATAEGSTAFQTWTTTIPTAGTYTFKLQATTQVGGSMNIYTALTVIITEVA